MDLLSLEWPDPSLHWGVIACMQYKHPTQIGSGTVHRVYGCRHFQSVNTLKRQISFDLHSLCTFEVLISSKEILITQIRMMHHWILWSIYTHHHSDGSCTSSSYELFQTLFLRGAYIASDSAPARTRVWLCETRIYWASLCSHNRIVAAGMQVKYSYRKLHTLIFHAITCITCNSASRCQSEGFQVIQWQFWQSSVGDFWNLSRQRQSFLLRKLMLWWLLTDVLIWHFNC